MSSATISKIFNKYIVFFIFFKSILFLEGLMDIKERIWEQFKQTGEPGLYMLYKALGEEQELENGKGENP